MKDRSIPAPLVILFLLVFAPLAIAQTSATPEPVAKPSPSAPPADYDLRWVVKIAMREKDKLYATVYLPKYAIATACRNTVNITLSPYISDSYPYRAAFFVSPC